MFFFSFNKLIFYDLVQIIAYFYLIGHNYEQLLVKVF